MAVALLLFALPFGAWCQSLSSCGGTGDHLKDVKISVSPDPIAWGEPFSIDLSGNLDAVLSSMSVDTDLSIKASPFFFVVDTPVKKSYPISISPGIAAGPQAVRIGPLTLPDLPGSMEVDGTIKITNDKKEAVACINLALNVPAESEEVAAPVPEVAASDQTSKVNVCSAATDHLHNLASSSAAGVSTITGTLDEAVNKFVTKYDLTLKLGWISHKIDMAIPVSYSPGWVEGDFKLAVGPAAQSLSSSKSPTGVVVTGTVKIDDSASSEIACFSIDEDSEVQPIITV